MEWVEHLGVAGTLGEIPLSDSACSLKCEGRGLGFSIACHPKYGIAWKPYPI